MATQGHYDLIVLDGMLPGIDGLGVLAALRHSRDTPVLMLTARGTVEDRVKGLQSGADDYLTKPFAFSELVARLHVLMRRGKTGSAAESTVLRLHDLEMDLLKRILPHCTQVEQLTLNLAASLAKAVIPCFEHLLSLKSLSIDHCGDEARFPLCVFHSSLRYAHCTR